MMIQKIFVTGGLVQLAYKNVIKYDKDWNKIYTYKSVQECVEEIGKSYKTLYSHSKNKKDISGFYYIIQENEDAFVKMLCDNCGTEFMCQTWRKRMREHVFCSRKCSAEWVKSHSENNCECAYCKKIFHRKNSHKERNIKNYCSRECANIDKSSRYSGEGNHQYGLVGKLNASWKSDERTSYYGYKLIRMLSHPYKNVDGFVFEHRLIAEKYLLTNENKIEIDGNFYLNPAYVVHHLDFNRKNNSVENLLIMDRSSHTKMHQELENSKEKFKEYCIDNGLDFEKTYQMSIYNKTHYRYQAKPDNRQVAS